jgi:hypothetical protein
MEHLPQGNIPDGILDFIFPFQSFMHALKGPPHVGFVILQRQESKSHVL